MNLTSLASVTSRRRKLVVQTNSVPTVSVGVDQTVAPGDLVTLRAIATDVGGSISSYVWSRVSGTNNPTATGLNTDTVTFTAPGTADALVYQCVVTDNNGATATDSVQVTVSAGSPPVFVSALPPDGTQGVPYSYQFTATGAVSFSIVSGVVPTGLTLSSSGLLSGTPTTPSSFSFVVGATNPAGTTNSATKTVGITASGGSSLSALPYNQSSIIVNSGTNSQVTDPLGTGQLVFKSRVVNTVSGADQEVRAEQYWPSAVGPQAMHPATDYWWAFGLSMDPTEALIPPTVQDDEYVVMQTHTRGQGNTQPDIALMVSSQYNQMRWRCAYNTRPPSDWNYNGGSYPDTENSSLIHGETLFAVATRYRYAVHYRPGYTVGHSPMFEVWRSANGGAWTKLFTHTGFNTYNVEGAGVTDTYLRYGQYKHNGSYWKRNSYSFYYTPMYFGTGVSLLTEAQNALSVW